MNIVVLQGSPNKRGSTNILVEEFMKGAENSGHCVKRFDVAQITGKHMKSALLTVAWNSDDWTFEALESHYKTLVRYLHFEDCGMVLGRGCGSPSMTRHTVFPKMAYESGQKL